MAFIDLPLEKLKKYKGSSPRPKDFDEFWKKALDEEKNTKANIKIKKAAFALKGFECADVFYDGVRGGRIHAKLIKPAGKTDLPIALHFHGYRGRAGDWNEYLSYASAGFCVLSMDCRGQGGQSTDAGGVSGNTNRGQIIRGLDDGPESLLFRQIFLDTVTLADIAKGLDYTDETKLFAYGGSQGGALTLACAALNPEVGLLAPVYPFLSDYRRVWELGLDCTAYEDIRDYFRLYDPKHEREDEIFNTLGYIDVTNLASMIEGETILAVSLNDATTPPSTVFAAYNNISAKKEIHIYPDFAHEHLPGFSDVVIQKAQNKFVEK